MGLTHIRTPKNFVLEERLERYARAIETHPEHLAGHWAHACYPLETPLQEPDAHPNTHQYERVHLDLGCGKGSFIIQSAQRDPRTLFIGMDTEPICIAYAAQGICTSELPNAIVTPRGAHAVEQLFSSGEVAAITLNFSTPYPKAHDVRRRLTTIEHLMAYRHVLAPGGTLTLRTDSQPLRDWSLIQLDAAGYETLWVSDDVRADHPDIPETEYETRLRENGAHVWGVCATPGVEPTEEMLARGREANPSLMTYLPDDLDTLDYVPLGMEAAVLNARNRRRRAAERNR